MAVPAAGVAVTVPPGSKGPEVVAAETNEPPKEHALRPALRASSPRNGPEARPEDGRPQAGHPIKVMVVEDEAVVAMDLQGTLRRLGYEVVGRTARAEDVVQLATARRPDVILMDIRLAGPMDGIEAARRVCAELGVPVVFLTAHADDATLGKAKLAHPYGYVVKPFDAASLHAEVEIVHYRRLAERERERADLIHARSMQREVDRLDELNEMRARFVSMASHELNTPLTPILLSVDVLNRSLAGKIGPKEERSLRVLGRNLKRLAALVRDLLDAARIQSNHLAMRPVQISLRTIVAGVAETFRARATEKQLTLQVHADGPNPVVADTNRITQVVTNLVHNAMKFTPPGGRIDVVVANKGENAEVQVQDTGRGLDAAQIAQLFQPFAMVHDIVSTEGKGTGLGLYLSRSIAELHGGDLTCKSAGPGRGSTFTLTIPVRGPPAVTTLVQQSPQASSMPSRHRGTSAKRPPRPSPLPGEGLHPRLQPPALGTSPHAAGKGP